jgi:chromosome segregation ATPase
LRLRNRELQAYRDITSGIVTTSSATGGGGLSVELISSPSSSRSRRGGGPGSGGVGADTRVAEMTRVVESMKKVIARLKSENERLSSSARQSAKWRKQAKELERTKERLKEVETEVERLTARVELGDRARTTLVRTERALQGARRQLRELRASSTATTSPDARAGSHRQSELDGDEGGMQLHSHDKRSTADPAKGADSDADSDAGRGGGGGRMEVLALEGRVRELEHRVQRERDDNAEMQLALRDKAETLEEAESRLASLRAQTDDLKAENTRLVQELSAFDLVSLNIQPSIHACIHTYIHISIRPYVVVSTAVTYSLCLVRVLSLSCLWF